MRWIVCLSVQLEEQSLLHPNWNVPNYYSNMFCDEYILHIASNWPYHIPHTFLFYKGVCGNRHGDVTQKINVINISFNHGYLITKERKTRTQQYPTRYKISLQYQSSKSNSFHKHSLTWHIFAWSELLQ